MSIPRDAASQDAGSSCRASSQRSGTSTSTTTGVSACLCSFNPFNVASSLYGKAHDGSKTGSKTPFTECSRRAPAICARPWSGTSSPRSGGVTRIGIATSPPRSRSVKKSSTAVLPAPGSPSMTAPRKACGRSDAVALATLSARSSARFSAAGRRGAAFMRRTYPTPSIRRRKNAAPPGARPLRVSRRSCPLPPSSAGASGARSSPCRTCRRGGRLRRRTRRCRRCPCSCTGRR